MALKYTLILLPHIFLSYKILNNKMLRIAQDCSTRTKINTLFYMSYNTLPITVLHRYQILLFVHKWLFNINLLPSVFHDYFDLNTSVHSYSTSYMILHLSTSILFFVLRWPPLLGYSLFWQPTTFLFLFTCVIALANKD